MKTSVAIEMVTPAIAKEWLGCILEKQRKQKETYIQRLASDMARGNFILSPDAIVICKGALENGQHRLMALIRAGKSFPFLILRTSDEKIYGITDQGIKRTLADIIHVPHGCVIAACAKLVVEFEKKLFSSFGHTGIALNSEVLEFINKNIEQLTDTAKMVNTWNRTKPYLTKRMGTALIEIGSRKNRDTAISFVQKLYEGCGEKDAAYDMRERLIKNAASTAKLNPRYLFALLIKSMTAYFSGCRLGVLRMVEGEKYPTFE